MKIVKDLMVAVDDCGTVHQEETVCEAIQTLKKTRDKQQTQAVAFKYRVLLVLDDDHRVVGKLDHTDIVMHLDPRYQSDESSQTIAHTSTAGLSPALLKSLVQWDCLWNESFEQRCRKVLQLKVKDCMCAATDEECVLENELLEVAMHKLATGRHRSLLVTSDDGVVGILRLTDVFEQIAGASEDGSVLGTQ